MGEREKKENNSINSRHTAENEEINKTEQESGGVESDEDYQWR